MSKQKLQAVFDAIDEINQQDINHTNFEGKEYPKELLYGRLMSQCLDQYWPQANEYLQIAVRAQHIKRWHMPRKNFPMDRAGYLTWRKELGKFHASLTHELMLTHGYDALEADKTSAIVRKEKIKANQDSQTLEDVACLVFLSYYFDEFASQHDEDKVISILQKTWRKMSEQGHSIALSLNLPEHLAKLVAKALS